jgi:hypothetical protein
MSSRLIPHLVLLFGFAIGWEEASAADTWVVRQETSSTVCHVQNSTAAPLGRDLAGPFDSRKVACQKAKGLYDQSATDTNMCSGYGAGTVTGCKNDGVTLP